MSDLLPGLIAGAGGVLLLLLPAAFGSRLRGGWLFLAAVGGALAAVIATAPELPVGGVPEVPLWRLPAGVVACLLCLLLGNLPRVGSADPLRSADLAGLLLGLAGTLVALAAQNLWLLVAAVELASAPVVFGLALRQRSFDRDISGAWALRQTTSLVLILTGIAVVTGMAGSSSLTVMADGAGRSPLTPQNGASTLGLLGSGLIVCGVAVRLAVTPLHFGWPEFVFRASPVPRAAALTLPRLAGVILLVRVLPETLPSLASVAEPLLLLLAVTSLLWSIVGLAAEDELPRLLTAALIGQSGIVLLGLAVAGWEAEFPSDTLRGSLPSADALTLLGVLVDLLAWAGLLAVLNHVGSRDEHEVRYEDEFAGLARTSPAMALGLGVCLLSMCGMPLVAGFWTKAATVLLSLSVQFGSIGAAYPTPAALFVVAGVGVLMHCFLMTRLAIRLLIPAFAHEPVRETDRETSAAATVVVLCSAALLLAGGMLPRLLLGSVTR